MTVAQTKICAYVGGDVRRRAPEFQCSNLDFTEGHEENEEVGMKRKGARPDAEPQVGPGRNGVSELSTDWGQIYTDEGREELLLSLGLCLRTNGANQVSPVASPRGSVKAKNNGALKVQTIPGSWRF